MDDEGPPVGTYQAVSGFTVASQLGQSLPNWGVGTLVGYYFNVCI